MRKNIFLDFLSPDNWKTYVTIPKEPTLLKQCRAAIVKELKSSLNVAVLLTKDYCLLPPAFIIQSEIVLQAVSECSVFLDAEKVYLPLREIDIYEYINKKISEYSSVKDTHAGFYNDAHWDFLSRYQRNLIHRNASMGMTIAKKWIDISDSAAIWSPIVEHAPGIADQLRGVPTTLKHRGVSVTLEAVVNEINRPYKKLDYYINQAIQHEYLAAYVAEYDACILSNAPPKPLNENYLIPVESLYYDYRVFCVVLSILGIKDFFLAANAEQIVEFMHTSEYHLLIDMYTNICRSFKSRYEIERTLKKLVDQAGVAPEKIALQHSSTYPNVRERIKRTCESYLENNATAKPIQNKKRGVLMKKIAVLVATDMEYATLLHEAQIRGYAPKDDNQGDLFYKNIILNNGVIVNIIRSEIGALQVGGAFNTTHKVIDYLDPDALIMCGICLGNKYHKEAPAMGDILVSTDIWDYETAKLTDSETEYRGKTIPVSPSLVQLFRRTVFDFSTPVHFGLMAAGDKLVNKKEFIQQLASYQPSIIGAEMEGLAVVSTCQAKRKDCILVKAICDWGFDKTDDHQQQAATNSSKFVLDSLESIVINNF